MTERTEHGWRRHRQGDRPTSEAIRDRETSREIYRDLETDNTIFVGPQGRTHFFTPDGKHHTSFRTHHWERLRNVQRGRWQRVDRSDIL